MLVIAHLSDLHVDGSPHSAARAELAVRYVAGLGAAVDAVVVTGDIADHGRPGEYARVGEILSILAGGPPVIGCPGNHDAREAYRTAFPVAGAGPEPADAPVNRVHRVAGATLVMCDSTIPGRDDGLLAAETIGWLDRTLAATPAGEPVFVCFHHPPVVLHAPFVDAIRQRGEHRLERVIRAHPQVVALLCGHAHTAAATVFAGRPLLVAPGVASALALPYEPGAARSPLDHLAPPALALHLLGADGRLTTHYRVVVGGPGAGVPG